ncbi:PQQ-binding-like beta-propeller repeat protein [Natronomonas salina]|uniref:PQQ-binding-like beta-propeller repeat protein n=1 Tax=Natronomonas salina TaxID=1710540 RepID=UPI001BABD19E|nr:PQQ-binding-like beta-propeller repeat protein [Natronomonas salina]
MHRRQLLATTGSVFGAGLAGCLSESNPSDQPTEPPADWIAEGTWPQVNYDARNSRYVPDATGPGEDAEIAWSVLGDRAVYPPVVDEELYLTEAWTDGRAFSLSPSDGEERWANSDLPPMRWGAALYEDLLLVITREQGNVVRLHALDTESGQQEWVHEEDIRASSGQYPPTAPTVYRDMVYIASDRGVIACDAATGETEWTATLGKHVVEADDGPTWRTDWAKPAVTDAYVYTFDTNERYGSTREIYAVDRASGEQDWTAELEVEDGWSLTGHIVAGSERVFVSAINPSTSVGGGEPSPGDGRLFAVDAATGDVEWDWERSERMLSQPTYAEGRLFVGAMDPRADKQYLHALDATDGSAEWSYEAAVSIFPPTIAGDTVYLTHGEELAALARADGTRRWGLDLGAHGGLPVVTDDTVYVLTDPGRDNESQLLAISEP